MRPFGCASFVCGSLALFACASGSSIDYREFYVGEADAAGTDLTSSDDAGGFEINLPAPDAGASIPTGDAGAPVQSNDSGFYVEPSDASSNVLGAADAGRDGFDSGMACTLTLSTGDPSCDSCIGASCCGVDAQCGNDPDCLSFAECADNCETPEITSGASDAGDASIDGGAMSCLEACEAQYPTGANLLSSLDSCIEGTCGAQCGAP